MNCRSVPTGQTPKNEVMQHFSLMGAMTSEQVCELMQCLVLREYAPGQSIFQQGELPSSIYLLHSGQVDFVVENEDVAHLVSSHRVGSTFGESAYLGIQAHAGSAYVRGEEGAKVYVLTRDALLNIQNKNALLFAILMMNLAREVSRKLHHALSAS